MDRSAQRDDAGCILFFEFNDLQHGVEGVASIDRMQNLPLASIIPNRESATWLGNVPAPRVQFPVFDLWNSCLWGSCWSVGTGNDDNGRYDQHDGDHNSRGEALFAKNKIAK